MDLYKLRSWEWGTLIKTHRRQLGQLWGPNGPNCYALFAQLGSMWIPLLCFIAQLGHGVHVDPTIKLNSPTGVHVDPTIKLNSPTGVHVDPTIKLNSPTRVHVDPTIKLNSPTGVHMDPSLSMHLFHFILTFQEFFPNKMTSMKGGGIGKSQHDTNKSYSISIFEGSTLMFIDKLSMLDP